MSDWQPGDLALCVDAGPPKFFGTVRECAPAAVAGLRVGAVYTVEEVGFGKHSGKLGLRVTGRQGGVATRFTKIEPHTPDAQDIETIRLLNGKPVPVEA